MDFLKNYFPFFAKKQLGKSIFKEEAHNKHFLKKGWVKTSFLNHSEIEDLNNYIQNSEDNSYLKSYGFSLTNDSQNSDFIKNTAVFLRGKFASKIDNIFCNYITYDETYLIKSPNKEGFVPPHQDYTFTDEHKFQSLKAWIPLQDVFAENGALGVIHGSHHFADDLRGSPLPFFTTCFDEHTSRLFPYLDIIEMKAGEVLFFDDRLLHGSLPNTSEKSRNCVGFGLMLKEAPYFHYFLDAENTVHKFEISPSFSQKYSNAKMKTLRDKNQIPADLKVVEKFEHKPSKIDWKHLKKLIEKNGNAFNPELEKLKSQIPYPFQA